MMEDKKCDCGCGLSLPKGRRRFYSNKHKDRYHNRTNPRGIYAHLAKDDDDWNFDDMDGHFSNED